MNYPYDIGNKPGFGKIGNLSSKIARSSLFLIEKPLVKLYIDILRMSGIVKI